MQVNPSSLTKTKLKTVSNPIIPTYYPQNYRPSKQTLFPPQAIFALPEQVITKHDPPKKLSQLHAFRDKSPIRDLSQPAMYYQSFMRKTVLSQTKQKFKVKQRHQSVEEQKKAHATLILQNVKEQRKQKVKSSISNRTAYDTLKLLQKVILKEKNCKPDKSIKKSSIEVEANKLPLIQKEGSKRQRVVPSYDPKYKWQPSEYPTKQQISRIYYLKHHKVEKPDIRGWDDLELQFD